MNWKNKICIGIAQFSGKYGITNKGKKKFNTTNIKNIFKIIQNQKLTYIDTAISYKTAERNIFLSNIDTSKLNIITKIPKPNGKSNYVKGIVKEITLAKNKFKINKFHSILLHECNDLKKKEILEVSQVFNKLKKMKLTKYSGISIYKENQFNNILKYFKPDVLQVPLNVFDRTFLKKKFLKKVKKNNIQLHVRSIFLQGILLSDTKFINKKFRNWKNIFHQWEKFCNKNKISKIEAATNFVLNIKEINKIVVGFYNDDELYNFLNIKRKYLKLPQFTLNNKKNIEKLIKPYNWK